MSRSGTIRLRRFFAGTGTSTSWFDDRAPGPELEERIDVLMQRVWLRKRVRDLMDEDKAGEGSHEEESGGTRISDVDDAGVFGRGDVVGDDAKPAAGRGVVRGGIERNHQRRVTGAVIHLHCQVLRQSPLHERHPFGSDTPKHGTWVARCVGRGQVEDALGQRDGMPAHGRVKEILLRLEVPKEGGRGDTELAGDVCERRSLEAFQGEDAPGGFEDLLAAENRWTSHL